VIPVFLFSLFHDGHVETAANAGWKPEGHPLRVLLYFNKAHFLEPLDPALYGRRLRGLVAEPLDEFFHAGVLFLLESFLPSEFFKPPFTLVEVLREIALVDGNLSQREFRDGGADRIEKPPVVGDGHDSPPKT